METQRILMRSLAVVVFASVIWTITVSAGAPQKLITTCCTAVSGLTREQFNDPIISFRMVKRSPPCLKAVVFKTERGEFCFNLRLPWVREQAKLLRAERNNSLTSTPAPASSISKLTPVGGQTHLSRADAQQKEIIFCKDVSGLTREQFNDPIISFRMLKQSPPCQKAVVFNTERGEFCFDRRLPWVREQAQLLRAQRNNSLTSTPAPASSISKLTPVGGQTHLSRADAQQKEIIFCKVVSGLTREQFNDPIISFRMLNQSPPCQKAVVFNTERGEFCFHWRLPWVKESSKKQKPVYHLSVNSLLWEDLPNQLTDHES